MYGSTKVKKAPKNQSQINQLNVVTSSTPQQDYPEDYTNHEPRKDHHMLMPMYKGSNSPAREPEPRQDLPPLALIMKPGSQDRILPHNIVTSAHNIVTSASLDLPNLPASDVYSAFHQ
jgi:hypothetical protein